MENNSENNINYNNGSPNNFGGPNSSGFNQKDIDAMNQIEINKRNDIINRGVNNKNIMSDDNDDKTSEKQDLNQEDELENTKEKKETDKEDKNSENEKEEKNNENKKSSKLHNLSSLANGTLKKEVTSKLKKKIARIVVLKLGIPILIVLGVLFFFIALVSIFSNFFSTQTTYSGVSESETESGKKDGLTTSDKYKYVKKTCDIDNYTEEKCLCDSEDKDFYEQCRGISVDELNKILEQEDKCNISFFEQGWEDFSSKFDPSINDECELMRYIKSSIAFYENKYDGLKLDKALTLSTIFYGFDTQYIKEGENYTPVTDHYKTLKRILEDDNVKIKRKDIDDIIKNSIDKIDYKYYISSVKEDNTLVCKEEKNTDYKYNIQKWKMFMRFGESENKSWESGVNANLSLSSSSNECISEVDDTKYDNIDQSVKDARNYLGNLKITDVSKYVNVDLKNGDYQNGFAYKKFPIFKTAIDNGYKKYDSVQTPALIEKILNNIIDKKAQMNGVLGEKDPDEKEAPTIINTSSDGGVLIKKSCKEFHSFNFDTLNVNINGKTISFKDYIINKTAKELESHKNEEYVKTQMIVLISNALNEKSNYVKKGNEIYLEDSSYSHSFASSDIYTLYEKMFNNIKKILLLDNNEKFFNITYDKQIKEKWLKLASLSNQHNRILSLTYNNIKLIQCTD